MNKALFGCMCIHINLHVLRWNRIELSLIPLQSTSTYVDWDEYMRIETKPKREQNRIVSNEEWAKKNSFPIGRGKSHFGKSLGEVEWSFPPSIWLLRFHIARLWNLSCSSPIRAEPPTAGCQVSGTIPTPPRPRCACSSDRSIWVGWRISNTSGI